LFAIVDIETTGGSAAQSAITEVAVLLHNGREVEDRFSTLVNPESVIPHYITALTGIDNAMVSNAPTFSAIAPTLFGLLQNRIFVAHNVNFDHSFLHYQFKQADLLFQPRKLCTVRYAKKLVPGLPSYSLGNLCRSLGIPIEDRHRAAGDATATTLLFEHLLAIDEDKKVLHEMTKGRNPHSYLPMHVPAEVIENLPYCPGVYYFRDKKGKVVYVGKAVNLKFRVKSHFTNNAAGRRRQEMLRNIHSIDYTPCATELMAIVLESIEIKRLWPLYNRSQKRYEATYGLYSIQDHGGRLRLLIDKKKKVLPALHTFSHPDEGHKLVANLAASLDLTTDWVFGRYHPHEVLPDDLNNRMQQLIDSLAGYLPDFALVERGEDATGNPRFVTYQVLKGTFKGMGCTEQPPENWESVGGLVTAYPENEFIRNTLFSAFARKTGDVLVPQ
jgi:DNA polymerase III subunit epsilon